MTEKYYCVGATGTAGHCADKPNTQQCDYCKWAHDQKTQAATEPEKKR